MFKLIAEFLLCAVVIVGLAGAASAAEEGETTHTGTVIAASAMQLAMKTTAGVEQTLPMAEKFAVTLDGKEATVADLQSGTNVTVTANPAGHVTKIVATSARPKAGLIP